MAKKTYSDQFGRVYPIEEVARPIPFPLEEGDIYPETGEEGILLLPFPELIDDRKPTRKVVIDEL